MAAPPQTGSSQASSLSASTLTGSSSPSQAPFRTPEASGRTNRQGHGQDPAAGPSHPTIQQQNASIDVVELLSAQQEALLSSNPGERVAAARPILDLLLGHPNVPALSEAMLNLQLHTTFMRATMADLAGANVQHRLREVSLKVLQILASQPALHSRLVASGIRDSVSDALRSLLADCPNDDSPAAAVIALGHLCLAGTPPQFWALCLLLGENHGS